MTKEELEKEAIKASDKKCVKGCSKYYRYGFQDGYLAGAEPREKRIAELEQKLEQTEKDLADYQFNYPTIKELQKENAELKSENQKWKDEWQEQVQKATDEGYARTLQTIQLTKAKQFIRDFLAVAIDYIDPIDKNYSLIAEGQQLLSEVEK